jgi:hypothetical protein
MGLVLSIVVPTVLAARAGSAFRWKEVLLLALLLVLGSTFVAVVVLKMQPAIWPQLPGA